MQQHIEWVIYHNQDGFIPGMEGWYNITSIHVIYHINRMKGKHHMIILIERENAFGKNQHPFRIKTLNKLVIEGKYLHIIKATYNKIAFSSTVKSQNLYSKIRKRQSCPLLSLHQH